MADLYTTDPTECFAQSPFGFGPFPWGGDVVVDCPPYPEGTGFGGIGWADSPYDPPPGGLPYGLGPYGSALFPFPVPPFNGSGGFGADPYGLGPYGSTRSPVPPSVTAAVSVSAWEVEVYFSEEMDPQDANLINPGSYTVTTISMAADTEVESVTPHLQESGGGVLSVILRHTGMTLGGTYRLKAEHATDTAGNPLSGNDVLFLARGAAPSYTVTPISGDTLRFVFDYPLLSEGSVSAGSSDIEDPTSFAFGSEVDYPVSVTPLSVQVVSDAEVLLEVKGMTSLPYRVLVGPATALGYDGTVLPPASSECVATEVYPGNGVSSLAGGHLNLTRTLAVPYGWEFRETGTEPGGLTPTSTFRVDLTFNAQQGQYSPPLSSFAYAVVGELVVEDGPENLGTRLTLQMVKDAGTDTIILRNGAYSVSAAAAWSIGTRTISLVRNMLSGAYVVLFDEQPIISTPITNFTQTAEDGPGVWILLPAEAFSITGFQVHALAVTATGTIFSQAWNFFHNVGVDFTGSPLLAGLWVPTKRGPLVKDWGDATPATAQDVTLRVNGVEVEVSSVNPYIGKVYPKYPIPLMPTGEISVDVGYRWLASPIMEMAGLNTEGLVLNKWDRPNGHHDPAAHGEQIQDATHPKGAPDIHRFPLAVVLGPVERPQPLLIGHRYMGFERAYSALLNSPTTLLLNQSPFRTQTDAFEQRVEGESVTFGGTSTPVTSDPSWNLLGTDAGAPNVGQGTYTVMDALTGSYDPTAPQVVVYSREADLTFPSAVTLNARFVIEDYEPEGVFTGVAFGFHNNREMYLVGALVVNGLEHVGMLIEATRPDIIESWQFGPKTTATINSRTTLSVPSDEIPLNFEAGGRFQILTGHPQVGVYTAASAVAQCDGTTTITISGSFPADFGIYGNNYPTVYFETPWSTNPSTYRLLTDPTRKISVLSMSGEATAQITVLEGSQVVIPPPSEFIFLDVDGKGQVFWGSLSAPATNRTVWSFLQYGVAPDQTLFRGHAVVVTTEMGTLPDEDPSGEWARDGNFGYGEVTGSELLLKSDVASESLKFTFGYERIEPFFVQDSYLDLRTKFQVDSGLLGAGDCDIVLNDGVREVRLSALTYLEGWGGAEYRRLLRQPVASLAGLLAPTAQGWSLVGGSTGASRTTEDDLLVTQAAGQEILYRSALDISGVPVSGDRIFEARLAVESFKGRADGTTGIHFGGDFAPNFGPDRALFVRLKGGASPTVQLVAGDGTLVQDYPFDWTDGEFHSYRVVTSQGAVTLYLDDSLQLPTRTAAEFPGGTGNSQVLFGAINTLDGIEVPTLASSVRWRALSYAQLPIQAAKRTLGVWRGGDRDHINSWELPRTDSSDAPNSAQAGPSIQQMDWRQPMQMRILRTPGWGVSVFRPDMALPPYYNGRYVTDVDTPSAAWINVEYPELPRVSSPFGFVAFGALDRRSVTQQRWDYIRYRLYKVPTEDYLAPQGMILNQFNIITSGEPLLDTGYENLVVASIDNRRVSLLPTHIYAQSIWKIVDGSAIYTAEHFTFDRTSQTITLGMDPEGNPLYFSGDHAAVTVVFIPGKPYTSTYLQTQPLLDSGTLLNEGTPPVPKSQQASAVAQIVRGDGTEGPDDSIGESIGYDMRVFKAGDDARYEDLTFFETNNGGQEGLIHPFCEGILPQGESGYLQETLPIGEPIYSPSGTGPDLGGTGQSAGLRQTGDRLGVTSGAQVIEFRGTLFWEKVGTPKQPDFETLPGSPGQYLYASGGGSLKPTVDAFGNVTGYEAAGGLLGVAILYPNHPASQW